MSQVADLIKQQAGILDVYAQGQLQKQAAVDALIEEGIDQWTAAKLVDGHLEKSAGMQVKILDNKDVLHLKDVLEKAASYITELEGKVEELSVKIETSPDEIIKQAETQKKLASFFTEDEIKALEDVPNDLIEKLANVATSVEPWEMGRPSGMAVEKTDPFLNFLMS